MRRARTVVMVVAAIAVVGGAAAIASPELVSRTAQMLDIGQDAEPQVPQVLAQAQAQPQPQPRPKSSEPAQQVKPESEAVKPTGPRRTETVVHDSWTTTCQESGEPTTRTCTSTLQIVEKEKRQVLFAWVIGRTSKGVLTSFLQTPTGVQIQPGVDLKLGEFKERNLDYVICVTQRCEAALVMDDPVLQEAMKSLDGKAVATITLTDGRKVNFTMPIKGLDEALAMIGK